MSLKRIISFLRGSEPTESIEHRYIPLLVSPLAQEGEEEHGHGHGHGGHGEHQPSLSGSDTDSLKHGSEPRFKRRHEASTIELFYDLFFVANLATFTVNHEISSGTTLRSYLGFFALLWATWFQTSMFDVRFAYDSVFLRICKAVHFGVQIGFTLSGAVFSTNVDSADESAFQTLAIVQMVSRLTLVLQYASILWFVKGYPRCILPLLSIMTILFVAAMIYFGTYFGFTTVATKTYYAWYIVAPVEVVLCIVVSSVCRVLSFKHTNLAERIGLLTLIVIGEGILGLSKSVSYLLQASTRVTAENIGVLVSSVLLIYFIYMLYFDQIQNHRFGTIKQQVWALLHFPLHLCILLTVEGSTNLFIWVVVAPVYKYWSDLFPGTNQTVDQFYNTYPTSKDLVKGVEKATKELGMRFKADKQVYKYYDYYTNITSLANIEAEYGSDEWSVDAEKILLEMWNGVGNAIFEIFGVKAPKDSKSEILEGMSNIDKELSEFKKILYVFNTVMMYFYIAAGLLLVVLALMYVIGNKRKRASEWFTVFVRIFAGAGITMALVGIWFTAESTSTANYITGPWHVILVMLTYLIVMVVDNFVIQRAVARRKRNGLDVNVEKALPIPPNAGAAANNSAPHYATSVPLYRNEYQYQRAMDSEENSHYY